MDTAGRLLICLPQKLTVKVCTQVKDKAGWGGGSDAEKLLHVRFTVNC